MVITPKMNITKKKSYTNKLLLHLHLKENLFSVNYHLRFILLIVAAIHYMKLKP